MWIQRVVSGSQLPKQRKQDGGDKSAKILLAKGSRKEKTTGNEKVVGSLGVD